MDNKERKSEGKRECRFLFQNLTHFPARCVIMGCLGNENNKPVWDVGGDRDWLFQLKTYPEPKGPSLVQDPLLPHKHPGLPKPPGRRRSCTKPLFSFTSVLRGVKIVPESLGSGRIAERDDLSLFSNYFFCLRSLKASPYRLFLLLLLHHLFSA